MTVAVIFGLVAGAAMCLAAVILFDAAWRLVNTARTAIEPDTDDHLAVLGEVIKFRPKP